MVFYARSALTHVKVHLRGRKIFTESGGLRVVLEFAVNMLAFSFGLVVGLGLIGLAAFLAPRNERASGRRTLASLLLVAGIAVIFVTTIGPLIGTFRGGFPSFAERVLFKAPRALLHLLSPAS